VIRRGRKTSEGRLHLDHLLAKGLSDIVHCLPVASLGLSQPPLVPKLGIGNSLSQG
jgi:hypothetical protein